jgi:hypothetical protein
VNFRYTTEGKDHQGQQNMLQLTVSLSLDEQEEYKYFQDAAYNVSTHVQPFLEQNTDQHIWYTQLVSKVGTTSKLTMVTQNAGPSANHAPKVIIYVTPA